MEAAGQALDSNGTIVGALGRRDGRMASPTNVQAFGDTGFSRVLEGVFERVAPCPWGAHAGLHVCSAADDANMSSVRRSDFTSASKTVRPPLYTAEQRARRDASPWTTVQAVLAPIQFAVCAASLLLILRYLATGRGYEVATASILVKTAALYAIMVTGSIWEKAVFGRWLFARAFFWEDVFSFAVLGLQTTYVACLLMGWGSPRQQMMVAIAAYATYAINAAQFLLKLRAARLDAAPARRPALAARA